MAPHTLLEALAPLSPGFSFCVRNDPNVPRIVSMDPRPLKGISPPAWEPRDPARAATRGGVLVGRLVCGELKPGKRPGRLSRPGLPRPVWARGGRITLSYGTDWTPDPTVKLSVTGS